MANISTIEGVRVSADHWIGGARVPSADMFLDHSPIDGELLAMVARGGVSEIDEAVATARHAFEGWRGTSAETRAKLLRRIAEVTLEHAPEIALVECTDGGAPLVQLHERDIPAAAATFEAFAQLLEAPGEPVGSGGSPVGPERRAPVGVAAVVTSWSAPFASAVRRVAPALAAGDTVVLKPSERTPLTASILADVVREAGLPDGVLNVVQGLGEEAGAALAAHPGIDRLAFSGSSATGRLVGAAAGRNLVPISLELAGRSPFVVFADADPDAAVAAAIGGFEAWRTGLGAVRLVVEEPIAGEFVERLLAAAGDLAGCDPRRADACVGPLLSRVHRERVEALVRRAEAEGARVVLGGGRDEELAGLYYRPTLVADVPPGSEILTEDLPGPVLTLQRFATEEEAVALADAARSGAAAAVFTADEERGERVGAAARAGTVWVNPSAAQVSAAVDGAEGRARALEYFSGLKTIVAPRS